MNKWVRTLEILLPDLIPTLLKRYQILQVIEAQQPIGRRSLAEVLGLTERVLRSETEFLKEQGLVFFSTAGMKLSHEGEMFLSEFGDIVTEFLRLHELERELQTTLGLNKVIIVPGDSSHAEWIKKDLGRATVEYIKQVIERGSTIAVTGGTTLAAVAEAIPFGEATLKECLFLPARGGLGEEHENQANTICSQMAKRSGGKYRLLHVPEQLSKEAYHTLLLDPQIAEVTTLIRSAKLIIHGIGEASIMARRRKSSTEVLAILEQKEAVAESFGYYFDQHGEIVYKSEVIGLRLKDLPQAKHIIAVAGGRDKAAAILAFLKYGVQDVLITDEGAAKEMKRLLQQ